ncbi:Golgi phosphoprotein 3 [Mycena olivaceomarginata]|nr:Golgi phosphoprotein 3 [Mycena olivaceomarginata]
MPLRKCRPREHLCGWRARCVQPARPPSRGSHAMRICILIELALRRRIGDVRDLGRKRSPLPDRPITVISTRQTGETLLDETLKMMKQTEDTDEKMGVGTWVDLLSACARAPRKGLVDKRVLRTEKRNFLLSDMATHPAVPPSALDAEGTQCRIPRAVCLACAACTASVLDNAFGRLGYEREADFGR